MGERLIIEVVSSNLSLRFGVVSILLFVVSLCAFLSDLVFDVVDAPSEYFFEGALDLDLARADRADPPERPFFLSEQPLQPQDNLFVTLYPRVHISRQVRRLRSRVKRKVKGIRDAGSGWAMEVVIGDAHGRCFRTASTSLGCLGEQADVAT